MRLEESAGAFTHDSERVQSRSRAAAAVNEAEREAADSGEGQELASQTANSEISRLSLVTHSALLLGLTHERWLISFIAHTLL